MVDREGFSSLPTARRRGKAIIGFKLLMAQYKINHAYRFETMVWVNKDYPPGDDRAYHSFTLCMN